jgi:hypothetical protein
MAAISTLLISPRAATSPPKGQRGSIERLLHRGRTEAGRAGEGDGEPVRAAAGRRARGLESAPGADVIFMAHLGFPDGFGEAWRELPHATPVQVRTWHVPAEEIPAGTEAVSGGCFEWWKTLDAWVGERRQASSTATLAEAGRVR